MSIDEKLNKMEPKDTPLLVLGYIILGMMLLLPATAVADNIINIEQAGSSLELDITQSGSGNKIGHLNNISLDAQITGNNKDIDFTMDGKNNQIKTWSYGDDQIIFADINGDTNILSLDNHGDSNVLKYWATGDNNTAHMEIGNNNDNNNQLDLRQFGLSHSAYVETNDDSNIFDVFQGGGQDDNFIRIVSGGDSNSIVAWQGKHSDGDTDTDEVGGHEGYWIVSGSNNVLKSYQTDTNRSGGGGPHDFANYITGDSNTVTHTQKGKAGHTGFIEIDGDSNSSTLLQKGNGAKWADLVLTGNGHALDVIQKGTQTSTAAIDLTFGTAAYDFDLTQDVGTNAVSYSITGVCYTAGGCQVSVTQSN